VVVYTRDAKLPESLLPRLREAAKKVNFDFDKDFTITDNSCKALEKGEEVIFRLSSNCSSKLYLLELLQLTH
jgi:violaxanthin de-epoxidase